MSRCIENILGKCPMAEATAAGIAGRRARALGRGHHSGAAPVGQRAGYAATSQEERRVLFRLGVVYRRTLHPEHARITKLL